MPQANSICGKEKFVELASAALRFVLRCLQSLKDRVPRVRRIEQAVPLNLENRDEVAEPPKGFGIFFDVAFNQCKAERRLHRHQICFECVAQRAVRFAVENDTHRLFVTADRSTAQIADVGWD